MLYFSLANILRLWRSLRLQGINMKQMRALGKEDLVGKIKDCCFGLCFVLEASTKNPLSNLTFVFCLQFLRHQAVLSVPKHKCEKWEDQGIQYSNDSQDIRPADRAGPKSVLVCLFSTHPFYFIWIPAIRENHTAKHKTGSLERGGQKEKELSILFKIFFPLFVKHFKWLILRVASLSTISCPPPPS